MAIYKRDKRMRAPSHPGGLLKEIVIPATELSITEIAKRLKVSRQSLYAVLNQEAAISPTMAVRLGTFFGNSPEFWSNMQQAYDLWQARNELGDSVKQIKAQRCEVNGIG